MSRKQVQVESLRKEGSFFVKEDVHMKGTFYHIDTSTEQLQMSFYTLGITYLKILISKIIVF